MTNQAYLLAGFLIVALQRLALDVAGVRLPLSLIILLALVSWLLTVERNRLNGVRTALYLIVLGVGAVSLLFATARGVGVANHISALFLFAAVYSPSILGAPADSERSWGGKEFFAGALKAIELGAVLALLQALIQYVQGVFVDPIGELPEGFRMFGYNQHYGVWDAGALSYTSIKPNGMIFLEPSFLSLYCALGIVAIGSSWALGDTSVELGLKVPRLLILVGGFAVSASATGLVLCAVGFLTLIVGLRRKPKAAATLVIGVILIFTSGVLDAVLSKASEGIDGTTSTALRLVLPYKLVAPIAFEMPLLGWGPGTLDGLTKELGLPGLQATTSLKLLGEYGLVGALLFAVLLLSVLWRTMCPRPLVLAVLAAWLIPSESLVNSVIVALVVVGVGRWREGKTEGSTRRGRMSSPREREGTEVFQRIVERK